MCRYADLQSSELSLHQSTVVVPMRCGRSNAWDQTVRNLVQRVVQCQMVRMTDKVCVRGGELLVLVSAREGTRFDK